MIYRAIWKIPLCLSIKGKKQIITSYASVLLFAAELALRDPLLGNAFISIKYFIYCIHKVHLSLNKIGASTWYSVFGVLSIYLHTNQQGRTILILITNFSKVSLSHFKSCLHYHVMRSLWRFLFITFFLLSCFYDL